MMASRTSKMVIVAAASALTIPALLSAFDRSAALADARPLVAGERRSLEGMRRDAAAALAAGRPAAAAAEMRSVLARQPLDRTALRTLAMAEERLGNTDVAERIAVDASFVSWHDPYSQEQMFLLTAANGDIDDAARRADALSRSGQFTKSGFASLNLLLSLPGGAQAVATRLATRPPWRDAYFHDVREGLAAASQRSLALVSALARTGAPASSAEIDQVLAFMVARGQGAEAWAYARARGGAVAKALVDDPDLQSAQIADPDHVRSPFAWSVSGDAPIRIIDGRDAAGRPALRVETRADRSVMFVSRRVVVSPGRYRLSYQAGGPPEQRDRLHPDLRCSNSVAVKLQPVESPGSVASVADVPANCPVLKLGFTIEPGESASPVELSIRDVAFTRL